MPFWSLVRLTCIAVEAVGYSINNRVQSTLHFLFPVTEIEQCISIIPMVSHLDKPIISNVKAVGYK